MNPNVLKLLTSLCESGTLRPSAWCVMQENNELRTTFHSSESLQEGRVFLPTSVVCENETDEIRSSSSNKLGYCQDHTPADIDMVSIYESGSVSTSDDQEVRSPLIEALREYFASQVQKRVA